MPEQTPTPPKTTKFTVQPAYLVGSTAILLVALFLTLFLLFQGSDDPTPQAAQQAAAVQPSSAKTPQQHAAEAATGPVHDDNLAHLYEETLGAPLEQLIRRVDFAILHSLIAQNYGPAHIELDEVSLHTYHGEPYLFQRQNIELNEKPQAFLLELKRELQKWAPEARMQGEKEKIFITLLGLKTHELSFPIPLGPLNQPQKQGKLSIVIDDMGRSLNFARQLSQLPYPVTFSILPQMPHSAQVADHAAQAGLDVMLHLPMEPKAYPKVRPGPGALFVRMSQREILDTLRADLDQMPRAVGVNNHMGSRFTSYPEGMDTVLRELKSQGLFFLDSLTSPTSVAIQTGRADGLVLYQRDIFLDNVRDRDAILRQLDKAQRVATRKGQAIAIGHPYPETLKALQDWAEIHNKAITMVPISALEPLR